MALFATSGASYAQTGPQYILEETATYTDVNDVFDDYDQSISYTVRVIRTIPKDTWCTICLPFVLTKSQFVTIFGQDAELADFRNSTIIMQDGTTITSNGYQIQNVDEIKNIQLRFHKKDYSGTVDNGNLLLAHYPYIIKVKSDINSFTVDNVIIINRDQVDAKVTDTNHIVFQGVHCQQTIGATYPVVYLSGGLFYYTPTNGITINLYNS